MVFKIIVKSFQIWQICHFIDVTLESVCKMHTDENPISGSSIQHVT